MRKIFPSLRDFQPILTGVRQQGKRVVFTNGCFDLLHPGHIHTLVQARALGDILVVGLNSDESVKRLKGKKRPILDQAERATVLAALEAVDYIAIFDDDTPRALILQLRPDVLVKGGDWSAETVVGKEEVEAWGGEVVLVPYQKGNSTTNIIERVLAAYRDSL